MFKKIYGAQPSSILVDLLFFGGLAMTIIGMSAFGREWRAAYNPNYQIDLSLSALPLYSLFSALRGFIAYLISLAFTLVFGYWAAKSARAEKIILPLVDIMQSIPVLGFLPGLVLSLVAIFPKSNVGLELASILMIFTGQVWNMIFAFYSSLKAVPTDLKEAATVMNWSSLQRLKLLELPYAAMNLTWNSLMSMAGGWFFLTVCEAFTLGNQSYHLPGLGAYMAVAVESGDVRGIIGGITAMALVILAFDFVLWRPALVLAHRFRLEQSEEDIVEEPLIQMLIKESVIVRFLRVFNFRRETKNSQKETSALKTKNKMSRSDLSPKIILVLKVCLGFVSLFVVVKAGQALVHIFTLLAELSGAVWIDIVTKAAFTLIRVVAAVIIGTLWAVPFGIWVVQKPNRLRVAQPMIQLMASFPAPMLYPLAIALFLLLKINFEISAMLLMLLGVQWYILFNVLAGALKIPTELKGAMDLIGSKPIDRWRYLFLPSILPSLVTGWITAAGGAWNASIVSEAVTYKGESFTANGLGAAISEAAAQADFAKLSASLVVMIVIVIVLNRTFWSKLYKLTQTRFRLDL